MAGSQTLRFDIVGDSSSASRAFKDTATDAALAAKGAKQLSDSLTIQSKSAQVSAAATVSLAKSDDILRDAQLALAGATDDASGSLGALKLRLDAVNGKVAAARVSLAGDTGAQAQLDSIDARLVDLDHKTSTPSLDIQGVAKATAELSAVDVALDKVGGSGGSAESASSSLGLLASPMGAAVAAGVALSPVLVTAAVGLGGFGAAAVGAARPILAAAQAAGGLQGNLQTLNPQQQQAARGLLALESQYSSFSKALAPEVFAVFNSGLGTASTLLHDAGPVAESAGKGLGSVITAVNADLNSAQWQQFFGFMAQNAAPDIQLLGTALGAVADDLPTLLVDLQPVGVALLNVVTAAAKAAGVMDQSVGKIEDDFVHLGDTVDSVGVKLKIPAGNRSILSLAEQWLGVGKAASASVTAQQQAAAAQQAAVTAAGDLSTSLTTLEARYGLTASQAQALVVAAGQTDTALQGSGSSAAGALKDIEGYANASLNARTPTQQLAGDVSALGNNTLGATAQLNAFTDAWNLLVGNAVSDQQAVLATSQAFQALITEVKNSGAQSLTSQSDFLSYVSSIGQGVGTLQKNGATVATVNAYYQTNIDRLNSLHNLTPAQRADVQGLTRDYDTWAHSTAGLNTQTTAAADTIKNNFTANLKALGEFTPQVNTDVNNLANAVLKTGTQSSATAGDRAKLIADLEKSGNTAQSAATLVNGLQRQIDGMHGKTVAVDVTIGGEGAIVASAVGLPARIFKLSHLAAGGKLPGFGGGDVHPALLESGETVVDKVTSRKLAGVFAAAGVPGYTDGGLVDAPPWAGGQGSGAAGGWAGSWVQGEVAAFFTAARAAAAAAAAKAAYAPGSPAYGGSVLKEQQFAASLFAGYGWSVPYEMPALISLWNQESGWNPYAANPTSNARGIPQNINGWSAYAPGDWANQIRWGESYIHGRYGDPLAAWAHETAFNWYGNGTSSARAGLAVVGEHGPEVVSFRGGEQVIPHQVIPGGRGAGDVHVHLHTHAPVGSQAELMRWLHNSIDELARSSRLTYALQRSPSARNATS